MTDPELKNLIARLACDGIAGASLVLSNEGYRLTDCSVVEDGSWGGLSRSVQLVVERPDGWPQVFEFTVRELQG